MEIFYDAKEYGIKNREFTVKIFFNDGGSLEVLRVNENGLGDMRINIVDEYLVGFLDVTTDGVTENKSKMQIYSLIAGEQLGTINDIVRNYYVISQYEKVVPDLDEYRINDDENYRDIIKRLYAEKILFNNTFFIDGKEYYPYKIQLSLLFPWRYANFDDAEMKFRNVPPDCLRRLDGRQRIGICCNPISKQ